jgi:hypothetical protein
MLKWERKETREWLVSLQPSYAQEPKKFVRETPKRIEKFDEIAKYHH